MNACEMIEIKPIIPNYEQNFIEKTVEAGFGPMLVAQHGCPFEPNSSQIAIVTFHDIALNYASNFQAFFNFSLMRPVLNRMAVFHINAPGQEDDADEIQSDHLYPSMDQLADSVNTVCNYLGIKHAILFGVGLGANVMARVALKNPNIADGLFMIHPVPTPAGWSEWMNQRRNIHYLRNLEFGGSNGYSKMSFPQTILDYLIWHHFGTGAEERNPDLVDIFKTYFSSLKVRPKNLASLIESYTARDDIGVSRKTPLAKDDDLISTITGWLGLSQREMKDTKEGNQADAINTEIKCSSFIITGNDSPFLDSSIQMLQRLRPDSSGWMKLFDCGMVLDEQPQKVAEAFILFTQGLGLGLLTHVRIK